MNDDLIHAFLSIVNNGSISAAADAEFTTQSRMSKKLKQLEEETGVPLLVRGRGVHGIELTSYGKEFLVLAERQEELNREMMEIHRKPEIHEISIGAVDLINCWTLREFYQKLLKEKKDLRLDIHTRHSREIYGMIESHAIDLGYVAQLLPARDVIVTPLYQEPMLILCTKGSYPKGPVSPQQLDPEKEIYANWSDSFAIWHDQIWPGKRYHMHVGTSGMLPDYLNEPGRWALAPVSTVRGTIVHADFDYHMLTIDTPKRTFYQLEQKNPSPSRMKTIEVFKKELLDDLKKDPNLEMLV